MPSAQEIVAKAIDLAALPAVYARVRELVDDPDSSPDELAKVIAMDPAITARLLRLANSAFWGRRGRIETVTRAVRLLGMNHVHDLVLATSVAIAFKNVDLKVFDVERYWRGSVYRAIAAGALARIRELIDVERLFLEGLLSDIGHLVLYQTVPALAASAAKQAQDEPWRLADSERALIGCDSAAVGGELARAWKLPECFEQTITWQDNPAGTATHTLEAGLVHIAAWLALRAAQAHRKIAMPALPVAILQLTELTLEGTETAAADAETNLAAMLQMFTPTLAGA